MTMKGNEIREKFLEYFERHGHTRVRSSPLLPANDPTLLFTNAGMNQFKDVFLGLEKRDYVRACSSQKCLRAGGKHNDLDEVGKTARHQTFFEMLGNFSFGDYFKEDATKFAWDLLVNEFKLDPARMWFTVFEGDDEVGPDEDAARFWERVGAPRERILRFGRKDNFWQMGETGPCGPCSEIHYYMGDDPNDTENCAANVNGPTDIITELWNLVFMQFDRSEVEPGKYKLTPLPAPSVDTGMGLERLAVVLQEVKSNYETDLLLPIIESIVRETSIEYVPDSQEGFVMRVLADHARATAFCIADRIVPGPEGRSNVLRKIMRRAIYYGHYELMVPMFELEPFFYKITDSVVNNMGQAYPELEESRALIEKIVKQEEERFRTTQAPAINKMEVYLARLRNNRILLGTDSMEPIDYRFLAMLRDTHGLNADLISRRLSEEPFNVTEEEFNEHFYAALREIQPTNLKLTTFAPTLVTGVHPESASLKTTTFAPTVVIRPSDVHSQIRDRIEPTEFRGYESTCLEDSKVAALIKGDDEVQSLNEGDEGEVILNRTPFYAEGGGQVGDVGRLMNPPATAGGTDLIAQVEDTYSPAQGLIVHKVKVEKGTVKVGDIVTAQVDVEKRDATRRNHTATHLVHAALREVLGGHVKQAGSVVAPNYLRFDFTHYQPMAEDEMKEVERLVNEQILRNVKVETDIMPVEDAIRAGAMALFGEKYSGMMRVLTVPGFSKELCGGTHVRATGDIGVFKITSDESIASGVRRIRAVTGIDAYQRFREDEEIIERVTGDLRTSRAELPSVIGKLQDELKKSRREAEDLRLKIASGAANAATNGDEGREIAGVRVLAREASGLDAAQMRQLSDTLLAKIKSGVVVLGRSNDGKASLIVRTSDDLTKRVPAGQVIKELAPIIGGKGGGKPDMAEGGGSQPEKLSEALQASYGVIERMLS
jgi:alanyl-tRNA synthetase